MVERPLSMREVPGSIPGISRLFDFYVFKIMLLNDKLGIGLGKMFGSGFYPFLDRVLHL